MDSINGKVALVTGAAVRRGMGHGVALRLAGEGADAWESSTGPDRDS
jgi:NAD(P)-dependent dehydrogenase (short-subunit alcohol dehydrogenase family)